MGAAASAGTGDDVGRAVGIAVAGRNEHTALEANVIRIKAAEQRTIGTADRGHMGAAARTGTGNDVVVAIAIASPLAWWAMNQWLQDFAYRIDIQWWIFVVAGLAAIVIAFLTVSFQSVKAALANPIKSLRSE